MARSSSPAVTGWMVSERTNLSTIGCSAGAAVANDPTLRKIATPQTAKIDNHRPRSTMACSFAQSCLQDQPRLLPLRFPSIELALQIKHGLVPRLNLQRFPQVIV